eukprot:jgi/Botrbrau1/20738/Bobra.0058s0066.1
MGLINIRDALKRPTAEARGVFEPEVLPDIPEVPPASSVPGTPEDGGPVGLQEDTQALDPGPQEIVQQPQHAPMVQLDCGTIVYEYDPAYIERKYEILNLKVIHRRRRTGFEETKDFPIRVNDLIAGRYQVMDFLGSAAFSKAVQALDIKTGMLVCLKIIKNKRLYSGQCPSGRGLCCGCRNNKDYLDQSLDEIKLLKHVNEADPNDEYGMLRLFDFFYYKEHLFLVCELLRANLYEFQKYNREQGNDPYFTLPRVQKIARQVLHSLSFLHALGLIHSDLKPENILIKSYSRCEVKKIDIWSLGCIIAELLSGYVLFQNDSLATLLARLEGILGPIPRNLLRRGRYTNRFFTRSGMVYERSARTGRFECLKPKRTSLRRRVPEADDLCLSFLHYLLTMDPTNRPHGSAGAPSPVAQFRLRSHPTQLIILPKAHPGISSHLGRLPRRGVFGTPDRLPADGYRGTGSRAVRSATEAWGPEIFRRAWESRTWGPGSVPTLESKEGSLLPRDSEVLLRFDSGTPIFINPLIDRVRDLRRQELPWGPVTVPSKLAGGVAA